MKAAKAILIYLASAAVLVALNDLFGGIPK